MASKLPAVKNAAYTFRCVLFAQSDNQIKANPTIAAGDWKVSTDGAAFANLATLPDVDPDSSVQVLVSLSADEMNGDEIMVTAIDASGAEWHSAAWVIHTAARTLDEVPGAVADAVWDEDPNEHNNPPNAGSMFLDLVQIPEIVWNTEINEDELTAKDALLEILTDTAEIGAAGAGLTALATQASVNDLPTNSELATALAAADDAVLAAIAALNDLSSAGAQAAAAAALAAYDAATGSDISGLNNLSAAEVNAEVVDVLRTDTIPDSYAADGAQPTIAQAVLMLLQFLSEREVSGTTITVKKPDGATAAMVFDLDDASNPTSITRSS